MDNKSYRLSFDVWKEFPETWNEREASHLINMIGVCRTGKHMKFSKYGSLSYDEEDRIKKLFPIATELDSYSRRSNEFLIFDLNIPNCEYDKIFIYQYKAGNKGFSGFYAHSTKTGNHLHKYYLPNDLNEIMLSLNKFVYDLDIKYNGEQKMWV